MRSTKSTMNFKFLLFFIYIVIVTSENKLDKNATLDSLNILKSSYVYMKNESSVFEKINGIVSQGANQLQFITDFDKTVTKQHYNNNKNSLHSFAIFYRCKQIPQSSLNAIFAALAKYDEVEFDPKVEIERKKERTKEMYDTANQKLKGFEFDRQEIKEVVQKYGPPLRDRTAELFSKLKQLQIPVVMFSAGVKDVIVEQMTQEQVDYSHINIISNHLKFNGTMLDGIDNNDNIVNTFNKHKYLGEYLQSEAVKNRKNIILMGDHTGDATMINGLENQGIVLKIGFSYNQTEDSMKLYKDTFDIVLDDDQTMNVVLDIIKLL